MKKKRSELITGILVMGLGVVGLFFTLYEIWIYFETGEISFRLKPMMPRFESNEALMMIAVMAIVWIMIILLGYTNVRKKSCKNLTNCRTPINALRAFIRELKR